MQPIVALRKPEIIDATTIRKSLSTRKKPPPSNPSSSANQANANKIKFAMYIPQIKMQSFTRLRCEMPRNKHLTKKLIIISLRAGLD